MDSRAIYFTLLLSSLPIAGCGTIANLARQGPDHGEKVPFGGVHHDVACIEKASKGEADCASCSEPEQYRQVALKVFWAADLPLSAIGDVLTWPYTATYTYINQPTPIPPMGQAPAAPVTQTPTSSGTQAPASPATQVTPQGQPKYSP